MKRNWTEDEMSAHWSLRPSERDLITSKQGSTRLGFALLLKFFQSEGRFPTYAKEIPKSIIQFMVRQVGGSLKSWNAYPWEGVTIKRHRIEIREWCQ
jgi:hypothetical protein